MFTIDSAEVAPTPPPRTGRFAKYPFPEMAVGESILFPTTERVRAKAAAGIYKRRHPGWNFTARKVPEGQRIWRTA